MNTPHFLRCILTWEHFSLLPWLRHPVGHTIFLQMYAQSHWLHHVQKDVSNVSFRRSGPTVCLGYTLLFNISVFWMTYATKPGVKWRLQRTPWYMPSICVLQKVNVIAALPTVSQRKHAASVQGLCTCVLSDRMLSMTASIKTMVLLKVCPLTMLLCRASWITWIRVGGSAWRHAAVLWRRVV